MNIIRSEYDIVRKRRQTVQYTNDERERIDEISQQTKLVNADNISRTHAYKDFYSRNPDVRWSFLASMVSRNAGWNMTDLEGSYYPQILSDKMRKRLFLTYERANWFIFSDAYPQLLLYEQSKRKGEPLFHLLSAFQVSAFMEAEWQRFWEEHDENRLVTALIINEQHMIQQPVIEHPFYKQHVFDSLLFKFQELFHFSAVLFPTVEGKLYGFSVYDFQQLAKRIELGKKLERLLFHPSYYPAFCRFSNETVHTGSRIDYEQYMGKEEQDTPYLRDIFPPVPHQRHGVSDWYTHAADLENWFSSPILEEECEITNWFAEKQKQLHMLIQIDQIVKF